MLSANKIINKLCPDNGVDWNIHTRSSQDTLHLAEYSVKWVLLINGVAQHAVL